MCIVSYNRIPCVFTLLKYRKIGAMDNDINSTIPFNNESRGVMNTKGYPGVKATVICVIITLNVIMNSLVIAVIARYPQLREDRTTLFMFSLSVSDLAAGCTFMPFCAALCYGARHGVAKGVGLLPNVQAFTMWWFGFNSMYSLCWLTISKTIIILEPFKVEQRLSHTRCYIIIGLTWITGCVLASLNFTVNVKWNSVICAYDMPTNGRVKAYYMAYLLVGVALPVSLILYGTVRMFIVVVRTRRRISALEHSVAGGNNSTGNAGFVTAQAIRSSKNVIIICIVSLLFNLIPFIYGVIGNISSTPLAYVFTFVNLWLYESNTFVNSLLYLVLFKSVRHKVVDMLYAILIYIRAR